jgi:hypothetical protein
MRVGHTEWPENTILENLIEPLAPDLFYEHAEPFGVGSI